MNLVEEGFDVALRVSSKLKDSSLIARKVPVEMELHVFASPAYVQRRGAPRTPEELARHDCVLFRPNELGAEVSLRGDAGERRVTLAGRLAANEFSFVRASLRAGGGIGLLPSFYAASDVAEGALVRVLPTWAAPGASLYVVYAGARHLPRKVTVFRDFVLETFRAPA